MYTSGSSGVLPRASNVFGKFHHLIDGFFAGRTADCVEHDFSKLFRRFARAGFEQQIHHHWNHDIHPAGSDEGKGAIKIEENHACSAGVGALRNDFNHY